MEFFPDISSWKEPKEVILADGDYPSHPIPLRILQSANTLICCDRAGMNAIEHGLTPTAIVGDGDSIPKSFRQEHEALFHIVSEQEDNDLTKATRYLLDHVKNETSAPRREVVYMGATGKREDHTLGNLSLMVRYYKDFQLNPVLLTDHGWFVIAHGDAAFESFPRQQVSIFNLSCSKLQGENLRWQPYAYQQLWQGTLNESTGREVRLTGDGMFMVFRTYEAKTHAKS